MIKYKLVVSAKGRKMYYRNGKMCSPSEVPAGILNNLENGMEISTGSAQTLDESTQEQAQSIENKTCLFCGEEGDKIRFVNLQNVRLCSKDYDSHTTGEIVAKMREVTADSTGDNEEE
jgi:hypothetical protein